MSMEPFSRPVLDIEESSYIRISSTKKRQEAVAFTQSISRQRLIKPDVSLLTSHSAIVQRTQTLVVSLDAVKRPKVSLVELSSVQAVLEPAVRRALLRRKVAKLAFRRPSGVRPLLASRILVEMSSLERPRLSLVEGKETQPLSKPVEGLLGLDTGLHVMLNRRQIPQAEAFRTTLRFNAQARPRPLLLEVQESRPLTKALVESIQVSRAIHSLKTPAHLPLAQASVVTVQHQASRRIKTKLFETAPGQTATKYALQRPLSRLAEYLEESAAVSGMSRRRTQNYADIRASFYYMKAYKPVITSLETASISTERLSLKVLQSPDQVALAEASKAVVSFAAEVNSRPALLQAHESSLVTRPSVHLTLTTSALQTATRLPIAEAAKETVKHQASRRIMTQLLELAEPVSDTFEELEEEEVKVSSGMTKHKALKNRDVRVKYYHLKPYDSVVTSLETASRTSERLSFEALQTPELSTAEAFKETLEYEASRNVRPKLLLSIAEQATLKYALQRPLSRLAEYLEEAAVVSGMSRRRTQDYADIRASFYNLKAYKPVITSLETASKPSGSLSLQAQVRPQDSTTGLLQASAFDAASKELSSIYEASKTPAPFVRPHVTLEKCSGHAPTTLPLSEVALVRHIPSPEQLVFLLRRFLLRLVLSRLAPARSLASLRMSKILVQLTRRQKQFAWWYRKPRRPKFYKVQKGSKALVAIEHSRMSYSFGMLKNLLMMNIYLRQASISLEVRRVSAAVCIQTSIRAFLARRLRLRLERQRSERLSLFSLRTRGTMMAVVMKRAIQRYKAGVYVSLKQYKKVQARPKISFYRLQKGSKGIRNIVESTYRQAFFKLQQQLFWRQ
jgi:hypothetical protein